MFFIFAHKIVEIPKTEVLTKVLNSGWNHNVLKKKVAIIYLQVYTSLYLKD